MSRPLALFLASATIAFAQSGSPSAPATPPASASPVKADSAATPPPGPRAVSPAMAEMLKASLPKLAPVKAPDPTPGTSAPDLREVDRPRNEIVRLPKYVVEEKPPPVFREQDIYTRQAFARRLAQRYYSEGYIAFSRLVTWATLGLVPVSPEATALARFREEERLRNLAEFASQTALVMRSDPLTGARMREIGRDTFLHWSDFGWQGGKPK